MIFEESLKDWRNDLVSIEATDKGEDFLKVFGVVEVVMFKKPIFVKKIHKNQVEDKTRVGCTDQSGK